MGDPCSHEINGISQWVAVPKTGSSQCQKCLMWMHGDAPPPTKVTCDFKKLNPLNASTVNPPFLGTGNGTTGISFTGGKIDENYQNELTIKKQMEEYEKATKVSDLEMEIKVKKIQLEAAKEAMGHMQSGTASLIEKNLMTKDQEISLTAALLQQQTELQAQILEQEKAKEQALLNILKVKELKEKLNKSKMAFHDTGHVEPEKPPSPKPLRIATGRKFR
jgi:hypothetical protein